MTDPSALSVQDYVRALEAIGPTPEQRAMAIAHARTPFLSMRRLGEEGGYSGASAWRTANAQYGGFASQIANVLGVELRKRSDGSEIKTSAIASPADLGSDMGSGEFRWKIRRAFAEALIMHGWVEQRPAWLDDEGFDNETPSSILPVSEDEAKNFEGRDLWLTSQWGFGPEDWGFVGFTDEAYRQSFIDRTRPGVIVGIYATFQSPEAVNERGKLLGFIELSHQKGDAKEFSSPVAYKLKQQDSYKAKKWNHGLKATRAWRIPEDHQPIITNVAPETYSSHNPQIIASRCVPLTPNDRRALAGIPVYETEVYGAQVEPQRDLDAAARIIGRTRGVDPGSRSRIVSEPTKARHLYILELEGDPATYLGWTPQRVAGRRIIKVGLSYSPKIRLLEIQSNYPKGVFRWRLAHSTLDEGRDPYPCEVVARAGEERMKDMLTEKDGEAHHLGGEFYLASDDEVMTAWLRGKAAAKNAEMAWNNTEEVAE